MNKFREIGDIDRVLLYGIVARGDETWNSDINVVCVISNDSFFEVHKT